ncbi:amidophosphoribosyltransferase [Synergistes jonesii]|uniref:Amidophosphoribosyltransferase n=1 Tax=Synergistes jonesii TaxID=2754 RepID=A0A073J2N9_9BACT|nr:amidophosphoribosyltransferase [Synergistes jonesii]KEJ91962.1 amidophosphoribosyltransferase [Synergistes jonesii]OFB61912.1 amidophosphoribosyltransferase [Synergistes jonesii]OFB62241.1 amidophosphoribosyltransferase [Synergistes jonesii]OFB62970.1 amidophosphoribosyltransferase [Synergistes jonesii]OFB67476.1 amidophosphoribosyltransferase [Synergistes jonesii]
MSGIFGAYSAVKKTVLEEVYLGLYALQHRGQESAGISWIQDGSVASKRGLGLLHNAIDQKRLADGEAYNAIGHVRYVPLESSRLQNVLPISANYARGPIAIAHDGLITNLAELTRQLEQRGAIFQSSTNSEAILHMMAQKSHMQPIDALVDALRRIEGSYALAVLLENSLVAARDPYGFKPLVLGEREGTYYVASESCALDIVGATLLRDVEPGEIVVVNGKGVKSLRVRPEEKCRRLMHCSFEYVYTARPDSIIDGRSVYEARKEMGRRLARKSPCPGADLVAGMPDSGTIAAIGYAQASKTPFEMAVVRNRYVGRTFIQPTQKVRELGVKIKLNPIEALFKGKKAAIVDDSIVRGTTAERIVSMIRSCGAEEVHLRIASPPVLHPCRYGIDTRKENTLAAVRMTLDELCRKVGADSLDYLSEEDLTAAVGLPEEKLCTACFSGKYLEDEEK